MPHPINPNFAITPAPPVMQAQRWLAEVDFPLERPLLNVSQAAPVDPPPLPLRHHIAQLVVQDPDVHLYGPVMGRTDLRAEIATQWSTAYGGRISAAEVGITSGCNQAFCAAIATLAQAGDAVILPYPWYFNHKMWLDMQGITCLPLPCGPDMLPDPEQAEKLATSGVKAIVLVTPNNPSGAEYPPSLLQRFFELARMKNIALVVDETYRDFDSRTASPHHLFQAPDWAQTLIHLYSFSKAYRLTGHRIGAMIAEKERLAEVEKFLDTVAICPNQLGQASALFGLQNLTDWLAGERQEILARRAAVTAGFPLLEGWKLLGCGAYFAYLEHPFDMASNELALRLLQEQSLLVLPGTMFAPTLAQGGDGSAERQMRIAFANVDHGGIATLFDRIKSFRP